ncbi:hypothetical protein [Leptospira sarikeiensis]|uniref:Uncharacterized protein n=1 Tax=Leptospira sarikeiensis TaxID=2484943 RepID=A0A4R9KC38_9LEPT|nr:hypothetical protein [Leptospira sarikeiensis]TGL64324.1 hypothetical protein EHQ64_03080 [Leptospira sarikeiensis]
MALLYKNKLDGQGREDQNSSLLALLGGSSGEAPLVIEPISWMSFPSTPVNFMAGNSGNYTVSGTLPFSGGCNQVNITFYGSKDGANITISGGEHGTWDNLYIDDCFPNYSDGFNVSGFTPGKARVIYRVSDNVYNVWFPDLRAGQIIGVVEINVADIGSVVVGP